MISALEEALVPIAIGLALAVIFVGIALGPW